MVMAVARLKLTKSPAPLERVEQATYFAWLRYVVLPDGQRPYDYAFAIPNGSFLNGDAARRAIQGYALRRQGVKAGYPDAALDLPIAPYHGLRIEFKRIGGAKPTPEQIDWHNRLARVGYSVHVCYGFEQAKAVTETYLRAVA